MAYREFLPIFAGPDLSRPWAWAHESSICNAVSPLSTYRFRCTLKARHTGPHLAGVGERGKWCAEWDGYPPELEYPDGI